MRAFSQSAEYSRARSAQRYYWMHGIRMGRIGESEREERAIQQLRGFDVVRNAYAFKHFPNDTFQFPQTRQATCVDVERCQLCQSTPLQPWATGCGRGEPERLPGTPYQPSADVHWAWHPDQIFKIPTHIAKYDANINGLEADDWRATIGIRSLNLLPLSVPFYFAYRFLAEDKQKVWLSHRKKMVSPHFNFHKLNS